MRFRNLESRDTEARQDRARRRRRAMAGMSIVTVLFTLAVLGILALIAMPRYTCMIQKSRMAATFDDLREARDAIEIYEAELGAFPPDLDTAYPNRNPPETLIYCVDDPDANAGHGNEWCDFFDEGNPSGNMPVGSLAGVGYILRTFRNLAPSCQNVDFAWVTCCGQEPDIVPMGEMKKDPGHPGHGTGKQTGNKK